MTAKKITGEIEISRAQFKEKTITVSILAKTLLVPLDADNASDFWQTIFTGAINLEASDIHLEPKEAEIKIRLRIDGVLQDLAKIPLKNYDALLSRIKLIAGLKLNISDRPQDGRLSITRRSFDISGGTPAIIDASEITEVRVSTLPSEYGEAIVLRILNPKGLVSLEELGLRKDLLEVFRKQIKKPNGMIIVTGPTGSGKTTTLYAFLKEVENPEIKIITIEDPIEYHLPGISQTQTDPEKGYDFASGLKAIVRQDPDVILVGEIRDLETAEISMQAALTGHLVFSTLHTNDASSTIARLIDLGVTSASIAAALNMVVAQRLIRHVCQKCAEFEIINHVQFEKINQALKTLLPKTNLPPLTKATKIPLAKGCEVCNFTGYRGRIGVFENFLIDNEMEKFILEKPASSSLRERAIENGMITMYQDALIRVLEGLTTIEEVDRVVGEES